MKLKELEKLGPKMKGIVSQSIKEVLQSLVDDGLVQADKIGSSNFFWSFPSQRGSIVKGRLDIVKNTRDAHEKQIEELKLIIEAERGLRPQTESRSEAVAQLLSTKNELNALQAELNAYGACDPAKVEDKRRGVILAKEAAIRWTDNYSVLLSYFTRQNGIDPNDVRKHLEVGDDYEDIC
ncbi:hypothetical protein HGRIS_002088 [Hohenbuehelia grisea]|uniref:Meiotic nuclear division protein 1 n=1 Tax=Hohenbuehelia grisea TaxID=104357 RepID=A0ABR3JK85_9AGAR